MRVLVIDDEPRIVALLERVFREAGYEADTCGTARGALARAREAEPDAITLDLGLPDIDDGMTALRTLRAAFSQTPIVVITALHDAHRDALTAGATAFVAKPFSIDHVVATMARALDRPPTSPR